MAILFLLIFKLTGGAAASLAASLSFGFFADFWAQAVVAEVYSLNVFFIALTLLVLVSYYQKRDEWLLWLLAFVSGLALAHHNTAAPIMILALGAIVYSSPLRLINLRTLGLCGALLMAGLSVFLYLPIRSAANPPMDWGNPETLPSMFDHIMRQQYAFGYTERPRALSLFLEQLSAFGQLASSQGSLLFPFMALASLVLLWKRDWRTFLFLAAILLVCGPALILAINFEVEREALETIKPFFLPVYLAMAILCGVFLASIPRIVANRRARLLMSALILPVALVPLLKNYRISDKSNYYYAHDYGMNLLTTIDKDGIFLGSSDHTTFPLIYLQSVEGVRPDVLIADKYGYIERALYEAMPKEVTSTFRGIPTEQERRLIEHWVMTNTSRSIFFTKKRDMQDLPQYELIPWGLTYKLVKKTDSRRKSESDLWSAYQLRTVNDHDSYRDYSGDSILCDYHFARGRESLYNGKTKEALDDFEKVAKYGHGVKEIYNNLGSVCAENGLVNYSMGYFEKALEIDPNYLLALSNLARLYEHMGDYEKAVDYIQKIVDTHAGDAEATLHLANLYELNGDVGNAVKTYQKAVALAPKDFRPFRALGYIYWSTPGARQEAFPMFAESLRRNPNQPDLQQFFEQAQRNQKDM